MGEGAIRSLVGHIKAAPQLRNVLRVETVVVHVGKVLTIRATLDQWVDRQAGLLWARYFLDDYAFSVGGLLGEAESEYPAPQCLHSPAVGIHACSVHRLDDQASQWYLDLRGHVVLLA